MIRRVVLPIIFCGTAALDDISALLQSGLRQPDDRDDKPLAADEREESVVADEGPFHHKFPSPHQGIDKSAQERSADPWKHIKQHPKQHSPAGPHSPLTEGIFKPKPKSPKQPNQHPLSQQDTESIISGVLPKAAPAGARCTDVELARMHGSWATDLSGMFTTSGLHFPNMTQGDRNSACSREQLVANGTIQMDRLLYCYAKRVGLTVSCGSCWADFAKKLKVLETKGAFGNKGKPVYGCTRQCWQPTQACMRAFTDLSAVGECLGPVLKPCLSCLVPATDRLTTCIGDNTPFHPGTLVSMLEGGLDQGTATVMKNIVEYIQGVGLEAMQEEAKLKDEGRWTPLPGPGDAQEVSKQFADTETVTPDPDDLARKRNTALERDTLWQIFADGTASDADIADEEAAEQAAGAATEKLA